MKHLIILVLFSLCAPSLAAGSYYFHVSCGDGHEAIARFRYGDIDPGRELARVLVGYDYGRVHKSCSVGNYNPNIHGHLPVEELKYRHTDGETISRALQGDPAALASIVIGVGETVANDLTKGPGKNNDLVGKNGWLRKRLGF